MTRNLKLFTIFCLLLLFCLGYTKTVKAGTVPTMNIDQASAILEYFRSGDNYNYKQKNTTVPTANLYNYLTNYINSADLMNLWNNTISTAISNHNVLSQKNLTWDNFIFSYYGFNNTQTRIGIYIVDLNNNEIVKVGRTDSNKTLNISSNGTQYRTNILITTSGISWDSTIGDINNGVMRQLVNINNIVIPYTYDAEYIYTPSIFTISDNVQVIENQTTGLTKINGNYAYVEPQEPIEGDTESSLGYYFYESSSVNVKQINKLSLDNYQNLDEWWYIGNDLNFNYDYYYLDHNNQKVSVKQYVDLVQTSNSGDTGKFYIPRIDRQQLDNLPNETGFYLDLTVNSGDIILANQFYSFVTYSSVVDSGATGTITNTSGDVTGNIDLTGIQSALTNEASFENVSVNSGDVLNSLGFEFETDPYANFWTNLTIGLYSALTSNVRSINITFRDRTYTINLDEYTTQEPTVLKVFFATISSTFVVMILIKWIKITIDEITSGDVDTLLQSNKEERNYKFILGGV